MFQKLHQTRVTSWVNSPPGDNKVDNTFVKVTRVIELDALLSHSVESTSRIMWLHMVHS